MTVLRGQRAGIALLRAFFSAPCGDVLFEVGYVVEAAAPDQILVLLELGALRAVFTPAELYVLGRVMIEREPEMRALGASEMALDDLRRFADMLLKSSREAPGGDVIRKWQDRFNPSSRRQSWHRIPLGLTKTKRS